MKKLHITKEHFEKSKYFTKKYGTLKFVSESGRLFKTSKGQILKFAKESKKANEDNFVYLRVSVSWKSEDDSLPTSVFIKVPKDVYDSDESLDLSGLIEDYFDCPVDDIYPRETSKKDSKEWLLWTIDEGYKTLWNDYTATHYNEGMKREVMPMNGRKSFGHKAVEEEDENGFTLYSYETPVARLERRDDGSGLDFSLLNDYLSATTLTHIHSWLIGHHQKDIPTKKLLQMNVGDSVPMMAAESKKVVKERKWDRYPAANGCTIHDCGDCFVVTNKNGTTIGQCGTKIEAETIAEECKDSDGVSKFRESKKLVKEGAGAGYTVTLKNVKLTNAKVINRTEDGDWEFEADIVKDTYMVEAEDYYNRFCPISEYDEEWVEVAGKVYGVCWWYEEERDVERQINGHEQDIGFDYGGGWTHVDLPKDGHITADRIRADEYDTWAIQSIELFAPQVSDAVNYCHEHFLDEEEGGEEEEVDESKQVTKETSDDLTLDEIYKAVKEEYGGKLFSDNFIKLNIEHVSG